MDGADMIQPPVVSITENAAIAAWGRKTAEAYLGTLKTPPPKPHVVSMGRYSCFASMAGKLWMITQKAKRGIRKKG